LLVDKLDEEDEKNLGDFPESDQYSYIIPKRPRTPNKTPVLQTLNSRVLQALQLPWNDRPNWAFLNNPQARHNPDEQLALLTPRSEEPTSELQSLMRNSY